MVFSKRCNNVNHKILIIAVAPAVVVTLILVLVVYRGNILQENWALAKQGQLVAAQLAASLEFPLANAIDQIPVTVESTVNSASKVLPTPVARVTVFDNNGQQVYDRSFLNEASGIEAEPLYHWPATAADNQVFPAPIYLDPLGLSELSDETPQTQRYLGSLILELSIVSFRHEQYKHFLIDIGLVLITFIGAVGLAHWTGQRFSRAIRESAQAISRIKSGDLAVRVSKTELAEIGTLQEGVNLLAETIQGSKAELEAELAKAQNAYNQTLQKYRRTLKRLRERTHEARKASRSKSLFLAKVSHETRTPLYSIMGLVERRLKSAHDADEEHDLSLIYGGVNNLYDIISDILDFTQLEKGKYASSLAHVDLWAEIEKVIIAVGPLASAQNLYLDVVVSPEVPQTVQTDRKAFRTIVQNLVANAIKFTETGGVCIRLDVEPQQPGGAREWPLVVRLQVADTGHGIPADYLHTIFSPFEQVDGGLSRRYEGTGLGLSIVKGYCDVLNGGIHVESQRGQGSRFTVTLPSAMTCSDSQPLRQVPINGLAGVTVVVVDQRFTFCESLRCRLTSLGANVAHQSVTMEALATIEPPAKRYDLLVAHNVSALSPEAIPLLIERLGNWARHIASLETHNDCSAFQRLREQGITAVLWCGATREMLKDVLGGVLAITSRKPLATPDAGRLREFLKDKTVLVVEDFDINRDIMVYQLESNGLQVIEAGDGDSAVAKAHQRVHLVLMDVHMPGKDGITAIKEIRSIPHCATLPIVGFTASADELTHTKVLAAGANTVLTKPISEEKLVFAICELLSKQMMQA